MRIENEQTERASHDFTQEFLDQTEKHKKLIIRLYEAAKAEGEKKIMDFCTDVLSLYEKRGINDHIEWKR